jgi:hypothetical protein
MATSVTWSKYFDADFLFICHLNLSDLILEQTSLEANNCSSGQEITCMLWNLMVHYFTKDRPLTPILGRMNPVQALILQIYSNIIPFIHRNDTGWRVYIMTSQLCFACWSEDLCPISCVERCTLFF